MNYKIVKFVYVCGLIYSIIAATRGFKLVTRGFELVTRKVELVTYEFELVALNS